MRNDLENKVIRKENEAHNTSVNICLYYAFNPALYSICMYDRQAQLNRINKLREDAAKLRKGYQWLDNSNAQWLSIIGARTTKITTTGRCYCTFSPTPLAVPNQATCVSISGCYRWETITTTTVTDEDNDGVVTKSSSFSNARSYFFNRRRCTNGRQSAYANEK